MRLNLFGPRQGNSGNGVGGGIGTLPDPVPVPGSTAPLSGFLDSVIVRFDPSLDAQARASALRDAGASLVEYIDGHRHDRFGQPSLARVAMENGTTADAALERLSQYSGVLSVERDQIVSIAATSNDPYYTGGTLWGMMGNLSSPANAFGSQAGEVWTLGATGSMRTVVGVIDTGIDYTHPELYRNIFLNQGEIPVSLRIGLADTDSDGLITFIDLNSAANAAFVTDFNLNTYIDAGDLLRDVRWEDRSDADGNGYTDDLVGWDFVQDDNDPFDLNRHGTHVAGIIGAEGGNGSGVAGVNWDIEMIPLRFLDTNGSGAISDGIAALNYYTELAVEYADIQNFVGTNNSYSSSSFSSALQAAIVDTAQAGQLFVAAAGNNSRNIDAVPIYPAALSSLSGAGYEAVISVASITSSGARSSFSNWGVRNVDLGAPGSSIMSTVPGGYASLNGTSMATPHVLGAAALISSAFPDMTASQIANAILSNTTATSSLSGLVRTSGRLDIGKVFTALGYSSYTPLAVQSVALSDPLLSIGQTMTVTITFTQAVTGFDMADIAYDTAGGSLAGLAVNPANARQWTALFTPLAGFTDATNTIRVLAGGYTGPQGETAAAATSANYAIDTLAPSATTFALPSATLQAGTPATLTITFNEDVNGLALTDFTWSSAAGSLANLAKGAGTTWTATFTPTPGVATPATSIALNASSYADLAGNPGAGASTPFAVVVPPDTTAPQVTSVALSRSTVASGQTAIVTFTFSEAVTAFELADLAYDTATGTVSNLQANPSNAAVWTATLTPLADVSDATNTITVTASSYTDLADLAGSGGTSANFAIDTLAPAITALSLSPASLAWGQTAQLAVTFSEAVSGLVLGDFTWNAAVGALSGLAQVGSTNEWRATFTPNAGLAATNASISLTVGSYADLAGNAGPGGTTDTIAVDTSNAPSTITGTPQSDRLVGSSASETFLGVPAGDTLLGRGTIDTMTGGGGDDRFVLADARGMFYSAGSSTNIGWSDYAAISDFRTGDTAQLSARYKYVLVNQFSTNTVIVADLDYNGRYSTYDDVVAVLQGITPGSLTRWSETIDGTNYTIIG